MSSRPVFILKFSLFALGFVALSVQIVIIREALALFSGNELVIGMCLGTWMLLTAAGAYTGSFIRTSAINSTSLSNRSFYSVILLLFLVLMALALIIPWELAFFKVRMLPAGVMAGIGHISVILVITLAPFCMVSGMTFPVLTARLSAISGKNLLHQAYALDSGGSILGGVIFSIFLFNLQSSIFNLQPSIFNFQSSINKMLYPGQEVLESRQTPFGKLTVTKVAGQFNLYENGIPILLEGDAAQREEAVHYAMLLHPHPQKVLLVSGGTGGTIEEVFKYSDVQVDYLENNPWIIEMADKYVSFQKHDKQRVINKDPRIFLNQDDVKYDVILLNTSDPNSAELNRFYTVEFFKLLKESLNSGGIISVSIPAAGNYMNESSRMLHSVMFVTLSQAFKNIRIIPGYRDYYLASDAALSQSLWENKKRNDIPTLYINPGYIDEGLMNDRSELILIDLKQDAPVNSDLRPYIYFQIYRQWLDQYKVDYRIIPAILVLITVIAFIFLKPLYLGLLTGGFSAASLEFILIIWFQSMYGVIYQMTGLIFAAFMAGMVVGSHIIPRFYPNINRTDFRKMLIAFVILPLILVPVMLLLPVESAAWLKISIIFLFVLITGFLMGSLFALSGLLRKTTVITGAGQSFSADLLGSAVGILLVSVYLVPLLGLLATGLMLAGMNVVSIIVFGIRMKGPHR